MAKRKHQRKKVNKSLPFFNSEVKKKNTVYCTINAQDAGKLGHLSFLDWYIICDHKTSYYRFSYDLMNLKYSGEKTHFILTNKEKNSNVSLSWEKNKTKTSI